MSLKITLQEGGLRLCGWCKQMCRGVVLRYLGEKERGMWVLALRGSLGDGGLGLGLEVRRI